MGKPPCLVQGELHADRTGLVDGWCLWPDRPSARATVEIAIDSLPVAVVKADRHADGAGDGRHGFSLSLPGAMAGSGTCLVEARERASGTVFGRVVHSPADIAQPIEDRLDRVDLRVLSRLVVPVGNDSVRSILSALGDLLTGLGDGSARRERDRLARAAPRLALSPQPGLSIVVPSSDVFGTTLGQLAELQGLCDRYPAEVIMADDGTDPRVLLLAQAVRGLRYMRVPRGLRGTTLNALAGEARGSTICFLQPGARPGNWMWPDGAGALHLGAVASGAAPRRAAPGMYCRALHGFALYAPCASLASAGGFDTMLQAGAAYADFARRCGLLNIPCTVWSDPAG